MYVLVLVGVCMYSWLYVCTRARRLMYVFVLVGVCIHLCLLAHVCMFLFLGFTRVDVLVLV